MGDSFPRDTLSPAVPVRDNQRQDEIAHDRAGSGTGMRLLRRRRSQEQCGAPGREIAQGEESQKGQEGQERQASHAGQGQAPLARSRRCGRLRARFPGSCEEMCPPWRGQSGLVCRESSRHFVDERGTPPPSPRNVATNGDAAANACPPGGRVTTRAELSPAREAPAARSAHRGRSADRPARAAGRPAWRCPGPAPRGRSGR